MTAISNEQWKFLLEKYLDAHFPEDKKYTVYGYGIVNENTKKDKLYTPKRVESKLSWDISFSLEGFVKKLDKKAGVVLDGNKLVKRTVTGVDVSFHEGFTGRAYSFSSLFSKEHKYEILESLELSGNLENILKIVVNLKADLRDLYFYFAYWTSDYNVTCQVINAGEFIDYCLTSTDEDIPKYSEEKF